MEDKVPWLSSPAKCFICYFPRKRIHTKSEPDIKMWLTGWHCWVSERTGGISPPSAAAHFWPQRVFINLRPWDLREVAKWKLKHEHAAFSYFLTVKSHNALRGAELKPALSSSSSPSKVEQTKALMGCNDELRSKHLSSLQIRRRCAHGNKLPWVSIITSKNCMLWLGSRCRSKLGFRCGMDQTPAQYSLFFLTVICCRSVSGWG